MIAEVRRERGLIQVSMACVRHCRTAYAAGPRYAFIILCIVRLLSVPNSLGAQVTFASAIDQALRHDPQVAMAMDDLNRAEANLSKASDVFIPSVIGSSGLGASSGITLTVPTIFTVSAQSLVYNSSQRDQIRAASLGVRSSNLALANVRQQVEEDTAITYLSLDLAARQQSALTDESYHALRLVSIIEDRLAAGMESGLDLKKASRIALQIKLQQLQLDDQMEVFRDHLARLVGTSPAMLKTVPESAPSVSAFSAEAVTSSQSSDTPNILSAEANARAKRQLAFADSHNALLPQIMFEAQYGRISPFNGVSTYYNLNGNYNTLSAGIQIQFPLLDSGRGARARESVANALHAEHETILLRDQQSEDRLKLRHSLIELETKAKLAEADRGIAQDELDAILIQESNGGGTDSRPAVNPKDEETAHIQERQKYLDVLSTNLELCKSSIQYLRQTGKLEEWLKSAGVSTAH